MSLTASAFAYSWSRWNSDCGKEKIVIQATEQETDEPPLEVNHLLTPSTFNAIVPDV